MRKVDFTLNGQFAMSVILGKKEIAALRLMVQSYTNNPKFGDASKFQSELDSAIYNVQVDISIFYHFLPF